MIKPRLLILTLALAAGISMTAQEPATLKDAYHGAFYVGVAINADQITGKDARGTKIVTEQFSSITPENALKWERVHPQPDTYDFSLPDQYVTLGEKHHMFIVGHTLVWHQQTPAWVFQDAQGKPISREALLKRLHDHIFTVVGRYKGRIQSWDVVNEALNDDGTLRNSKWKQILGDDYLIKAYQWAHEADPSAELNYNDYSLELPAKRQGAMKLIQKLQAAGIKVAVVGIQGHDSLDWPSLASEEETIDTLSKLGVKIAITELDIDVLPAVGANPTADISLHIKSNPKLNPYPNELPDAMQKQLARRYADLFGTFLKHRDVMSRVTLWGVTDADSWRNDWPVVGRTSYPLLWDRAGKPKPAYEAVIKASR